MPNSSSTPGIAGIVIGVIAVNTIIAITTGAYVHWIFAMLGLVVGLTVVQSIINR